MAQSAIAGMIKSENQVDEAEDSGSDLLFLDFFFLGVSVGESRVWEFSDFGVSAVSAVFGCSGVGISMGMCSILGVFCSEAIIS